MAGKSLQHVGVPGMRWGHRSGGSESSSTSKTGNGNNKTARNVAIGVGVGLTLVAAGLVYSKNKKMVDGAVNSFLQKSGKKKVADMPNGVDWSKRPKKFADAERAVFKKYGMNLQAIDIQKGQPVMGVKNGKIVGPINTKNVQFFRPIKF